MEPPLYYLLLWVWTRLFGTDEIAVRLLSMFAFLIATYIFTLWAEKRFGNNWISTVAAIAFFTNPMLLYYAFEVRAYGWYILFAVLFITSYMEKKWRWVLLAAIFGFYTHLYMLFLVGATALHYIFQNGKKLWNGSLHDAVWDPMIRVLILFSIAISPWLIRIGLTMRKLHDSWYFPVDMQLVKSALGNLYIGYEGTPWFLWKYTSVLSACILGLLIWMLIQKKTRSDMLYVATIILIPLTFVLGFSALIKPIYVNRYLIFIAIAELMLIPYILSSIRIKSIAIISAGLICLAHGLFSMWYPVQHKKQDYRSTIREIDSLMREGDVLYVNNALIYPEALYYTKNPKSLYLYNPKNSPFLWYIGDAIFSPDKNRSDFSRYPSRTFLLNADSTYSIRYSVDIPQVPTDQVLPYDN